MNRLIIVGNGFDLAHNLKTSYCDFLDSYIGEIVRSFRENGDYDDPLISIKNKYQMQTLVWPSAMEDSPLELLAWFGQRTDYFNVVFKSGLLHKSITKSKNLRWVDLENEYFDELLEAVKLSPKDFIKVKLLNSQFEFLKNQLEKYLSTQEVDLEKFKPDPEIKKIFTEKISYLDLVFKMQESKNLDTVLFLNFNYTNTLINYLDKGAEHEGRRLDNPKLILQKLIHIHGELNNSDNEIVFGFGDEYDNEYLRFENLKNNDVFKHIKSFAYFKTTNYDKLVRFLDSDYFQVYIIGHSCGLSDRTMFREIFEHEHCISVKIFYHRIDDQTDDFTDKTFEIARHFTNKNAMRKKISKKPNSTFLPQYKTNDVL